MAAVRAPVRRSTQAPARPRTAGRPPLRVVPGRGKGRRSMVPIVVAAVLIVFAVGLVHATLSQDGLRTAELERQVEEQTERLTLQRARVAQLSNPARVAEEAEKLGLAGDPDAKYLKVPLDDPGALERSGPRPLRPDPVKRLNRR